MQGVHFHGFAFARLTAALAAQGLGGDVIGVLMQPSAQHDSSSQRAALPRQADEDHLRHVLCQLCIPAHQAQRRRMDKVDVARDQFPEGRFRAGYSVFCQQFLAVRHLLFSSKAPHKAGTEQEYSKVLNF